MGSEEVNPCGVSRLIKSAFLGDFGSERIGKSTMLIFWGADRPPRGKYILNGHDISTL